MEYNTTGVGPGHRLPRILVALWLVGFVLSGCASVETAPEPSLAQIAADVYADEATDGLSPDGAGASAALCAPGRYTVRAQSGVEFAMASWQDKVSLTLLDADRRAGDAGVAAQRAHIRSFFPADEPVVVLTAVSADLAATGARYITVDDAGREIVFQSKGNRALLRFGDVTWESAEVIPLNPR